MVDFLDFVNHKSWSKRFRYGKFVFSISIRNYDLPVVNFINFKRSKITNDVYVFDFGRLTIIACRVYK